MKYVFKVIGGVHVILAFLKSSRTAQTAQKMAPPVAQRLLTNTWPKTRHTISIQENIKKAKKQYTNT